MNLFKHSGTGFFYYPRVRFWIWVVSPWKRLFSCIVIITHYFDNMCITTHFTNMPSVKVACQIEKNQNSSVLLEGKIHRCINKRRVKDNASKFADILLKYVDVLLKRFDVFLQLRRRIYRGSLNAFLHCTSLHYSAFLDCFPLARTSRNSYENKTTSTSDMETLKTALNKVKLGKNIPKGDSVASRHPPHMLHHLHTRRFGFTHSRFE